jgi:4-hydroxybenzoate polyprenyltransferase
MYAHGYLMLPDYIAIGLLIGNVAFLISLTAYAIRNISDRELDKESARLRILDVSKLTRSSSIWTGSNNFENGLSILILLPRNIRTSFRPQKVARNS